MSLMDNYLEKFLLNKKRVKPLIYVNIYLKYVYPLPLETFLSTLIYLRLYLEKQSIRSEVSSLLSCIGKNQDDRTDIDTSSVSITNDKNIMIYYILVSRNNSEMTTCP